MEFPFPVLVGDIGGTNARFALVAEPGAALSKSEHRATRDFPSLEAAVADAIPHFSARPRSLIACAAGPVHGRKVMMTNARWDIDGATVARANGLEQGLLLNDFEAQALTVPVVRDEWVHRIGSAGENDRGSQLILGPGTGLGAGVLIEVDGKHYALASEAGHVDFGPVGAEEAAIWPHIPLTHYGRISAEAVISGPGLLRLHSARFASRRLVPPAIDEKQLVERAKADRYGEEADTIRLFWRLTARFAGDMTMAFLATGGVTFSGGVLPRLVDFLDHAGFRARFEDKAPFGEMLRKVGTRIIIAEDGVLTGMSAVASDPDRYALDYAGRAWC